jgi:hypothetical protein
MLFLAEGSPFLASFVSVLIKRSIESQEVLGFLGRHIKREHFELLCRKKGGHNDVYAHAKL